MSHLLFITLIVVQITLHRANFDLQKWEMLTRPRLIVPTAQINTPLTRFPLGKTTWEIDAWEADVGHFEGTAGLATTGNIVLGGHVEYPDGSAGVFAALEEVEVGDLVMLQIGGMEKRYTVMDIKLVDQNDLSVLYPTEEAYLTLITCDEASYDTVSKTYGKRLVVMAASTEG